MRGKDLFEKFTNIKEEYIQEVETESERIANVGKKSSGNKIIALRKWAALAACIVGFLVMIPVAGELLVGLNESSRTDSATTTTTEGNPEAEESALEEESSSEFLGMYVDISTFPIYNIDVEMELMLEDRTVILETFLDNELEELVYDVFTNSEADEYLCTSTIHNITVLTEEEVESFADTFAMNLDAYVLDENLVQTAIVLVDVTWEETHGEIGGGTYEYILEGRYEKYFILGRVEGSDDFQVYGVYLCE